MPSLEKKVFHINPSRQNCVVYNYSNNTKTKDMHFKMYADASLIEQWLDRAAG